MISKRNRREQRLLETPTMSCLDYLWRGGLKYSWHSEIEPQAHIAVSVLTSHPNNFWFKASLKNSVRTDDTEPVPQLRLFAAKRVPHDLYPATFSPITFKKKIGHNKLH